MKIKQKKYDLTGVNMKIKQKKYDLILDYIKAEKRLQTEDERKSYLQERFDKFWAERNALTTGEMLDLVKMMINGDLIE